MRNYLLDPSYALSHEFLSDHLKTYDSDSAVFIYTFLFQILARQTFSDKSVAVAIGPQIDVFTSTDYVILHQIHFVTSSGQLVDQGNRTVPILPDPKSLSEAVAKFVKYLDWNTVSFLSQGK